MTTFVANEFGEVNRRQITLDFVVLVMHSVFKSERSVIKWVTMGMT